MNAVHKAGSPEGLAPLQSVGWDTFPDLADAVNKVAERPDELGLCVRDLTGPYVMILERFGLLLYPQPAGPPDLTFALARALEKRYLGLGAKRRISEGLRGLAAEEGIEIKYHKRTLWTAIHSADGSCRILLPEGEAPEYEEHALAVCLGLAICDHPDQWPKVEGNPYEPGTPARAQLTARMENANAFAATLLSGDPLEGRAAALGVRCRHDYTPIMAPDLLDCYKLALDRAGLEIRRYDAPCVTMVQRGRYRWRCWLSPEAALSPEQEAGALAWCAGAVLMADELKGLTEGRVDRVCRAFASAFLNQPISVPARPDPEPAEAVEVAQAA